MNLTFHIGFGAGLRSGESPGGGVVMSLLELGGEKPLRDIHSFPVRRLSTRIVRERPRVQSPVSPILF
jgi:hypothetical protein